MNEMDYGLKQEKLNLIIEVDDITREQLRLGDYAMM